MTLTFVHSIQSEWLKKRRSLAAWLVIIGSIFTPSILLIVQFTHRAKLPAAYVAPDFWEVYFKNAWESMSVLLLPMGIILAISLITQLEYSNNAWKQVHTLPQTLTTIFLAKLTVIVTMMLQLFILLNVAIYLSAVIPSLVFTEVPYPKEPIHYGFFLKENAMFFLDSLPIVALQYLLCLQFKNFLVPLGAGLLLLVATLVALSWKFGYLFPYSYCTYYFLGSRAKVTAGINIHAWAAGYFMAITLLSYVLYITKRDKG